MSIRPARAQDAGAMATILSGWIDETDWMPRIHTPAEDHGFVTAIVPRSVVWDAQGVRGFMTLEGFEIECLYIDAAARGQRIGRAMIGHAKAMHPKLQLWTFEANTAARRFYGAQGFVQMARTDGAGTAEKLPDVRLAWPEKGATQ